MLEAAVTCLQEKGYARTTTREIVATAGSHLPAVNYYFGSKERLLQDAIVEALRQWCRSTMEVATDPSPLPVSERLQRSVDTFFASLTSERANAAAAMEAFTQATRDEGLRRRLAQAYEEFREELAGALAAQAERDSVEAPIEAEVTDLTSVLIALFDGLAIQWLLDPERSPDGSRVTRSLEMLGEALPHRI